MVSCNTSKASPLRFLVRMVSCENIQRDEELSRRSSSLWDPTPGFCRANSSHRLCRMLRSPEWCPTASDSLGSFSAHSAFGFVSIHRSIFFLLRDENFPLGESNFLHQDAIFLIWDALFPLLQSNRSLFDSNFLRLHSMFLLKDSNFLLTDSIFSIFLPNFSLQDTNAGSFRCKLLSFRSNFDCFSFELDSPGWNFVSLRPFFDSLRWKFVFPRYNCECLSSNSDSN